MLKHRTQTFHHIIVGAPNVPQRSSIDIAGGEEVVVFLFLEEAEEEFHKLGPANKADRLLQGLRDPT